MGLELQTSNEWHVLKGEHQYGPYTYDDMVQMKQNNLLFDFDYVWAPHLEEWTLAGDLAEFSTDRLSRLIEKEPDNENFNRRATPRMAVDLAAMVHDDSRLWNARMTNISEGGALLLIENPLLIPGDLITVHVRNQAQLSSGFNCTAQILNKRLIKTKIHHDTALFYAVKFLNLTEIGKTEVTRLFADASNTSSKQQKKSS